MHQAIQALSLLRSYSSPGQEQMAFFRFTWSETHVGFSAFRGNPGCIWIRVSQRARSLNKQLSVKWMLSPGGWLQRGWAQASHSWQAWHLDVTKLSEAIAASEAMQALMSWAPLLWSHSAQNLWPAAPARTQPGAPRARRWKLSKLLNWVNWRVTLKDT